MMDRKGRIFVLPDKSLPTMILKEGQSFLRYPVIMSTKYATLFGLDRGKHEPEIMHIWHAPPQKLDGGVGVFAVTYLQKVRGDFPSTCHTVSLDSIRALKCVPALRKRIKMLLKDGSVPTMPLSKFVPEGTPYSE